MQNALKSNEWRRISVHKTFEIEIQNRRTNNWDFLQNWFSWEIRSPLFNMKKFQNSEKSAPESCRIQWHLMNDKEKWSKRLLKLKCKMGNQIIQTFCKIGSPQKFGFLSLICRNFKTITKVLLNHAECIEIQWMRKNFGAENFYHRSTERRTK